MATEQNPSAAAGTPYRWTFPQRVALVVVVVLLMLLIWRLTELVVLVFGAIIVAVALTTAARFGERRLRMPPRFSVLLTLLLILAILGLLGWFLGAALTNQLANLRERIPAAAQAVMNWLNTHNIGTTVLQYWQGMKDDGLPWERIAGFASITIGLLGTLGLMIVMGLYLAMSPHLYINGVLSLTPHEYRPRLQAAMKASGDGLSLWLLGQSISMLVVGGSTAIGLWLLGIPLAFSVGLISGLLAFIPFFGAIAGGLLAVLLAFMSGPQSALYVAILCIAIQQLEGHVVTPIVQSRTVSLPPVLGLAAALVFGVLFGLLGVVFATPLMVVVMILVEKLYVDAVVDAKPVTDTPETKPGDTN
jgi:predicted PurR-regulated permease PerM